MTPILNNYECLLILLQNPAKKPETTIFLNFVLT
jgi:hypothetical protein